MLIKRRTRARCSEKEPRRLHKAIDDQLERRKHSLKHAVKIKDASMQWDLIAAAVDAAVIKVFNRGKEDAEKMRGRSRITFS